MKFSFPKLRLPKVFFPNTRPTYMQVSKMFGIELELFLIDNEGKIANNADAVIADTKSRLLETEIKQECAESMVEITSFPHISSSEVFGKFFEDFESLVYEAEKNEMGLFNYSCYPGINNPRMRKDPRYAAKEKILGENEFKNAGRCVGFHFHYSLPKKSFNPNVNFFFLDISAPKKKTVLNLFNLYVALDPAITTFMQSSPYFEGNLLGKDSRIIAYRGDPVFNFPDALYSKHPDFGTLNEYSPDFDTMNKQIIERTAKWKALLKEKGVGFSDFLKKEVSILDSSWKPVKISPHGTIECRGMDMNSLGLISSMSLLLKGISKYVENGNISVMPTETGNVEPFKLEDNILYVPQMEALANLQKSSALLGFEDNNVLNYSNSLVKLANDITPSESKSFKVLTKMIDEKKTASDKIIDFVKKRQGYTSFERIEQETTQRLALSCSEKLYKDLVLTKKSFEQISKSELY